MLSIQPRIFQFQALSSYRNLLNGQYLRPLWLSHTRHPATNALQIRMASLGNDISDNLPSSEERRKSHFTKSVSEKLDNWQVALFTASQRLNDLTGYSGIERLKREIEEQEKRAALARQKVLEAKENYKQAIARRASSQKEVNELLQRKHAWTPSDLERFTALYRSDHANEQEEAHAHNLLAEAERDADEVNALLSRTILVRYHEEQIWSDKIRRASTWGTWALMGINIVLFIVVQLGLEPWKRRRLVGNFEDKVRLIISEQALKTPPTGAPGTADDAFTRDVMGSDALNDGFQGSQITAGPELSDFKESAGFENEKECHPEVAVDSNLGLVERSKIFARDLFTEREIMYRKIDISIMMGESAAAGFLVAIVIMKFLR